MADYGGPWPAIASDHCRPLSVTMADHHQWSWSAMVNCGAILQNVVDHVRPLSYNHDLPCSTMSGHDQQTIHNLLKWNNLMIFLWNILRWNIQLLTQGNNLKKIMAQKLLVLFTVTCLIASYSPFFHLNIFDSFQVKLQTRVRQTDRQADMWTDRAVTLYSPFWENK